MALDKLAVFNNALRHLGDVRLVTLTDDVAARYALDDAWVSAPIFVLRQAPWRFAILTANLSAGGSGINGYTTTYAFPADWARTHAVYTSLSTGHEFPFDFREEGHVIGVNAISGAINMRYVSKNYADPAFADWPEQFAETVAAYLAFLVAERVTGDPRQASRMSDLFSQLLDTATRIDAIDEDPWLPHQRDGSFFRVARSMADQAFWRFATKTQLMFTAEVPNGYGGFARNVAVPTDWTATRSLYVLTTARAPTGAGERRPFKVREERDTWYTDETSFYAEFVSFDLAMDSTNWPDTYTRAVMRELKYDRAARHDNAERQSQGRDEAQRTDAAGQQALSEAKEAEANADDPWLNHQLDGSFDMASRAVIASGYWWWALKTLQFDVTQQETAAAHYGFPYRYAMPSDWLRTHALFIPWDGQDLPINIRETNADWSTDAESFVARYVSTDALNPTTWPEPVLRAIEGYLKWQDNEPSSKPGEEKSESDTFAKLLAGALAIFSRPEDPWLRFQLDGSFTQAVRAELEKGRWRFAVKTSVLEDLNNPDGTTTPVAGDPNSVSDGSVSPGYSCRMMKPNDWMRTLRVYRSLADGARPVWFDIDYRDELDAIHTNYTPVVLRYLTRFGLDATRWPANFRETILSWLQYCEARDDPKLAAVAKERLAFYERQSQEAQGLDDTRDIPQVISTGRFVAGRYGRRSGLEQPWPTDII